MKDFKLLNPNTRDYLSDWVIGMLLKLEGLISLNYDFVNVSVNGENKGIYLIEAGFDTKLIERNNLRDGIIFKPGLGGLYIIKRNKLEANPIIKARIIMLENLWQSYLNGDISPEKLFDIEKFAIDFAICDLTNGIHSKLFPNLRCYFNPITNLIEPLSSEFGTLRYLSSWIHQDKKDLLIKLSSENFENRYFDNNHKLYYNRLFNNMDFTRLYVRNLDKLSNAEYLNSFFEKINPQIQEKLNIIYKENPFYGFPKEFIYNNQKEIYNALHPSLPILIGNLVKNDDTLRVAFQNTYFLPIEIKNIILNDSLVYEALKDEIITPSNNSENNLTTIDFFLKNKDGVNAVHKDKIVCNYNIIGLGDENMQCRIVYKPDTILGLNPTTMSKTFLDLEFLRINYETNRILIPKGSYVLNQTYIIPPNFLVVCEEGVTIDLQDMGGLISYSAMNFYGTQKNPIIITSSDSSGQGLCVINVDEKSIVDNVIFNNLASFDKNQWGLTGSITFYESDVSISNCVFSNNRVGDDFLNIVRGQFEISDSKFTNILADAFDSDYSQGSITNSSFTFCGNDGIDISGTKLNIKNVYLDHIGDKGLSAGERSTIKADSVSIINSEIAICSKDLSKIEISNYYLENNTIGFTAFTKKSEFGPAEIIAKKCISISGDIPYLIEVGSVCTVDGIKISSYSEKLKEIFYGVKYGKSSK